MLTIPQSSSSVAANGSMMPSWHYGNGPTGMNIAAAAGATNAGNTSLCGTSNNVPLNVNVNSSSISPGMGVVSNSNRMGPPSVGSNMVSPPPTDLLGQQINCGDTYSPKSNLYGHSSDFEPGPEFRARANTWHAEKKKPERQMLESLLEEEDDSPDDSLSGGLKQESLSPLGDSSLMAGSPASPGGGANSKKISRRNAWGNLSYADLITKAIECSPEKRLTLSQIYDWMVQNVPYFKDKGDTTSSAGWKNSIRHNLSLHTRFMRLQNESSGKSSWWVINPDASKSGKSPRRRAASIDTKNFERKQRGRIKKRLPVLHGSTSTDFGSGMGSRNLSASSINSASADPSHHDYRSLQFGSSTASLESRLQHLASNDPCWSESGTGSSAFDMELDPSSKGQTDSYHQQLFGGSAQGGRPGSGYGGMSQQTTNAAASTPPHLPTTYLQLQGSYHLQAVANNPNGPHHHGSPGNAGNPMSTFHTLHPSPFGQHPTASASSYNMPSYHLQPMSSYNGGNSNAMTHNGDNNMFQSGNGSANQIKSYSNLQPVALNSFKQQQQQQPQPSYTSTPTPVSGSNSGLVGTVHHHTAANTSNGVNHHHHQQSQLNQPQQLLGLGANGNTTVMNSAQPVNSNLPQDLDFFEPFVGSSMNNGSNGGLLGLSGGAPNGAGNFLDIADMDSSIGKDLCADNSLDANLDFDGLLSSQMS